MKQVLRTSTNADIPRLETLWTLAFGDGGDYLNNFFQCYYTPDRVLVLEIDGVIQAMTTWFPSTFVLPDGVRRRCAYLYAVATHPDQRGRGLATTLLAYCDDFLRNAGFDGVTTVPARPDLHVFFGLHGFQECFVQSEAEFYPQNSTMPVDNFLQPVSPEQYHTLRETLLNGTLHIDLDLDGIIYQAGASALSGGGMYHLTSKDGDAILCLEGGSDGLCFAKELLGSKNACDQALSLLPTVSKATRYLIRQPQGTWQFGMLKWLTPDLHKHWNWDTIAYMGFAFD